MHAEVLFLLNHPVVRDVEIVQEASSLENELIVARCLLKDKSVLFIRESVRGKKKKYSYHWQDPRGKLRIRWDNSPHHKHIRTFPHHKHLGDRDIIESSSMVSLAKILTIIENQLDMKQKIDNCF